MQEVIYINGKRAFWVYFFEKEIIKVIYYYLNCKLRKNAVYSLSNNKFNIDKCACKKRRFDIVHTINDRYRNKQMSPKLLIMLNTLVIARLPRVVIARLPRIVA
jgi:hypothetical protein